MASGIGKGLKRRKLGSEGDGQQWQRCHSGFDEEIILSDKYLGISNLGKGKRKAVSKLPLRTTEEVLPLVEKDIDIDWESSSSDDSCPPSPPILPPEGSRREQPLQRASQWLSTCLKPATLGAVPLSRDALKVEEDPVPIEDNEDGSDKKLLTGENAIDEASISDYESSEALSPSVEIPLKRNSASPDATPTQSPLISSYGQSTQDTANSNTSPVTSSQWVKKLQQTSPEKGAESGGPRTPDRVGGKDSAKKNKKFKSCGLAERLKKLINREKSDIAFWHHQSGSQLEASGAGCCIKVITMSPVQGLFVARCQNLSVSSDVGTSSMPDLPAELFVLFNRKTVQDESIQVGSTVDIYPPWQRLELPKSSETVLLCTYYCKATNEGGPSLTSLVADTTSPEAETQRPVFRPSRLFSGGQASPGAPLSSPLPSPNRKQPTATSLLDVLSVKGPSFDFEFSLRALVLRVCKMVPTRTTSEEQRWRMLVQDRDGTIFEVQTRSDEGGDLKAWEGKVVNADRLKISQRVTRIRNPSLFSVIDFYSHVSPADVSDKPVTGQPLQSISYIVNLRDSKTLTESQDNTRWRDYRPQTDLSLHEVCQRLDGIHRVSFHGLLIHATPREVTNPLPSSSPHPGVHLLFLTDPSLTRRPTSEGQNDPGRNYVLVEKLQSCMNEGLEVTDQLQKLKGSIVHMAHVFLKEGTLLLDCYSSITGVASDGVADAAPCGPPFCLDDCLTASYPPLSNDCAENTLVSVTGVMSGVDESTAYSWPVCDVCESNRLTGGDSSEDRLHCLSCDEDVSSPITQIHLQILLRCSTLDEANSIKVKLKQRTISDLFGDPSSEEPFDLKRILGKPYGPTHCFIRRHGHTDQGQIDFELEEI